MFCQSCWKREVTEFNELCPICEARLEVKRKLPESDSDPLVPISDDGITKVVPIVPIRGRLREAMNFLELDGFGRDGGL